MRKQYKIITIKTLKIKTTKMCSPDAFVNSNQAVVCIQSYQ